MSTKCQMLDILRNISKGITKMKDSRNQILEVFEKQPTDQESNEILENHNDIL